MSCSREGTRIAGSLLRRQLPLRAAPPCARRFASTEAEKPTKNKVNDLSELESASSFKSPGPDDAQIKAFAPQVLGTRGKQLPGQRYQYHPPKYDRGPLHPVQSPPSSDPIARDFVPGPFNVPRLKHTYDSTLAPDMLTMTYTHHPPGEMRPESAKGELRSWEGDNPYYANRPRRPRRGPGAKSLPLLERDITPNNIPEIEAVSISMHAPNAMTNKEYLHTARAVLLAISGKYPKVNTFKKGISAFKTQAGKIGGVSVTLDGNAAVEFVDKLVTLVLPKIKEWPGVKASSGDGNGNLSLGLTPDFMTFFPELEYNYSSYPTKMMPGCHISIKTTATSDRHGRLLLEALGVPFYGKAQR